MNSSTFKVVLFIFVVCLTVSAQNPEKQTATSTISGKVTVKGNGIAGISVGARVRDSSGRGNLLAAATDTQGNYRITNIPPGTYELMLAAPQFALPDAKTLIVGEGETLDGIDFAMVRGGVITGRITDEEGKPMIEEDVFINGPEGSEVQTLRLNIRQIQTDDRGVYRVFGLAPGKYHVSAGPDEDRGFFRRSGRSQYRQTYHPSTTDINKATVVEVTEGGEATNVDITLRRTQLSFTVSGRIIDGETGKPRPNVRYGLTKYRDGGSSSHGGIVADANGEFKFENLQPGKYAVFVPRSPGTDAYGEPVPFELIDQDIKGLVVKLAAGASVSGAIVFEGVDEQTARARFRGMVIIPQVESSMAHGWQSVSVNADGSFSAGGLAPGVLRFTVMSQGMGSNRTYDLDRIERNGEVLARGVELKEGEKLSGLRLIIRKRSSAIRGIVKIENGPVQSSDTLYVSIKRVENEGFNMGTEVDARGRFSMDGLAAGVYEVSVGVFGPRFNLPPVTQQVVLAEDQVKEITLTLDLKKIDPIRP